MILFFGQKMSLLSRDDRPLPPAGASLSSIKLLLPQPVILLMTSDSPHREQHWILRRIYTGRRILWTFTALERVRRITAL